MVRESYLSYLLIGSRRLRAWFCAFRSASRLALRNYAAHHPAICSCQTFHVANGIVKELETLIMGS